MKQVVNCNKELGMRIRYLRKSKDMTLESLSFESDVNRKRKKKSNTCHFTKSSARFRSHS